MGPRKNSDTASCLQAELFNVLADTRDTVLYRCSCALCGVETCLVCEGEGCSSFSDLELDAAASATFSCFYSQSATLKSLCPVRVSSSSLGCSGPWPP